MGRKKSQAEGTCVFSFCRSEAESVLYLILKYYFDRQSTHTSDTHHTHCPSHPSTPPRCRLSTAFSKPRSEPHSGQHPPLPVGMTPTGEKTARPTSVRRSLELSCDKEFQRLCRADAARQTLLGRRGMSRHVQEFRESGLGRKANSHW